MATINGHQMGNGVKCQIAIQNFEHENYEPGMTFKT